MKLIVLFILFFAITFSIKSFSQDSGTLTDTRDNHKYKWVKIGTQVWMAENLSYLPKLTKPVDALVESDVYTIYDFNSSDIVKGKSSENYKKLGVLYNWNAAYDACPDGWHIPSMDEWRELATFVSSQFGGFYSSQGYWTNIGQPLKATGTIETEDGLWKYSYDTK